MSVEAELSILYERAKALIAEKKFDEAGDYLKKILLLDENYLDASRLLAKTIRLQRRKWYKDIRLLVPAALIFFSALVFLLLKMVPATIPNGDFLEPEKPIQSSTLISTTASTSEPTLPSTPEPTLPPQFSKWERVNSGKMLTRDTINTIAVHPLDPSVIFVGTQSAGVYRSIDGGISWKSINADFESIQIRQLVIDPVIPEIIYALMGDQSLYKSYDSGESWKILQEGGWFITMDPNNHEHILVAKQGGPPALAESFDGGNTWLYQVHQMGCPNRFYRIEFDSNNSLRLYGTYASFLGDCPVGVYVSVDGGKNWQPPSSEINDIQTIAADNEDVFALVGREAYVFNSKDGGATWEGPVNPGGKRCNEIMVDPRNADTVYCAVESSLWISIDHGINWNSLGRSSVSAVNSLVYAPSDPNIMVMGGQGLAISRDGGFTWTDLRNGLGSRFSEIMVNPYAEKEIFLYEGPCYYGDSFPTYYSNDRGSNWEPIRVYEEPKDCSVRIGNDNVIYSYLYNDLHFTEDKGKTWRRFELPDQEWTLGLQLSPGDPGEILRFNNGDLTINHTSNAGKDWTAVKVSGINQYESVAFFIGNDTSYIYTVGERAMFFSKDGGLNWDTCRSIFWGIPQSDTRLAIDPLDSGHIYLATRNDGVAISMDGCQTWTTVRPGGIGNISSIVTDPNTPELLFAGTISGVVVSEDSGETWVQHNEGLVGSSVIYSLAIDPLDSTVYAVTPNGIFRLDKK